jgi:hypothetical protein
MSPVNTLADFLAGAVAMAYLVAALYFLKFWRRTKEKFFLSFAAAFALLAANQTVVVFLGPADERSGYAYVLRVVGFMLILGSIAGRNLGPTRRR